MRLSKCLVPVLVLLLVKGSSAMWCLMHRFMIFHYNDSMLHRICDSKQKQLDPTSIMNIINTGTTIQNGDGNVGSIKTHNQGPTNGNGNVHSDAPGNAEQPPQYDTRASRNLDGATYVSLLGNTNQNGTGNVGVIGTLNTGSSGQWQDALTAVTNSHSKVNHVPNQGPMPEQSGPPGQWLFVPFQVANAGGGAGPGQSNANADANVNAYANVNANGNGNAASFDTSYLQRSDGNGHPGELEHYVPKGETSAYANATANAGSQGKVNHIPNQGPVPEQSGQPGQWFFVPFQVANAGGGFGPSAFGGSGPSYGSQVPVANSASKADANAGSSGVGGFGGNAGNTGIISGGSAASGSGPGGYGGSNGGSVGVNAIADAVATAGASSGSWTDGAYRQGSTGGLSSAISNAHSNAFGGSTSSSSKSTANGSGNAMAQSSSSAISTDGKGSASSYASASADTNV